jgi:hypothetical protein
MPRYPRTDGLALPVTELGYEVVLPERRMTSQHHLYFPRAAYHNLPIRHQFRNLVDHVQTMRNPDHDDLHRRFTGPPVPHTELMVEVLDEYLALNGVINCVREKRTSDVYQILPHQWEQIRSGYGKTLYAG